MANVENLEKRLHSLINKSQSYGTAIALTGEWGIGKTHFWKNFYKKYHDLFRVDKYAYVSLFGLDNLDALKYQIAINTHNTTEKNNNPISLKKVLSKVISGINLPKIESNGFSLAITQEMINNYISNTIKDTLICIDDFERKSDKLDTKEIMGLINFLKEEKNCTIITILDEDKLQSEEFKDYKEKVFNEVLVLDQNISIIKEIIKDDEVFTIYEDFYNKLKMKNLRFYQKVHQYYKDIIKLRDDFTFSSKEYILRNLLLISMVYEKGNIILSYDKNGEKEKFIVNLDFIINFNPELFNKDNLDKCHSFNQMLNGFIEFYGLDDWGKFIAKNILDYEKDHSTIKNLIEKDFLTEQEAQLNMKLQEIMKEFHSLSPKPKFSQRLYDLSCQIIPSLSIENLTYYYEILKFADNLLAEKFEKEVKNRIIQEIEKCKFKHDLENWLKDLPYPNIKDDIFIHFIGEKLSSFKETISENDFFELFISFFKENYINNDFKKMINKIDKEILKKILWRDIGNKFERKNFIKSIIQYPLLSQENKENVRKWIIEILKEKIEENPDSKAPIEMWLEQTKDLTEFQ